MEQQMTPQEAYVRLREMASALSIRFRNRTIGIFILMEICCSMNMFLFSRGIDDMRVSMPIMFSVVVLVCFCMAYGLNWRFYKRLAAGKVPYYDPLENRDWLSMLEGAERIMKKRK